MTYRYFDAHTHAHFPAYDQDREAMLGRAAAAGVGIVTAGTTKETSSAAVALAQSRDGIWATVGVHPSHAAKAFLDVRELGNTDEAKRIAAEGEPFDYEFFKTLAANPKVVGVGECGLDFYRLEGDVEIAKEKQQSSSSHSSSSRRRLANRLLSTAVKQCPNSSRFLRGIKGF